MTLRVGTTDPGVLGPRHYPVWAYEPELFAARGELRARAAFQLDRLKDVPIPSPARRGTGAGKFECAERSAEIDWLCVATGQLPARLMIGGVPSD